MAPGADGEEGKAMRRRRISEEEQWRRFSILVIYLSAFVALLTVWDAFFRDEPEVVLLNQRSPVVWVEPEPELVSLGEHRITHYCACPVCCGKWSDGMTASGTVATEGRTVAVDPDVIPIGTEIVIDGHTYIAEDTGSAINGNRIDVFVASHGEALSRGVLYREVFVDAIDL